MEDLKASEIAQAGKKQVEGWLINNGFVNVLDRPGLDGASGIQANGNIENIFVHVKATMGPRPPERLNEIEKTRLKGEAGEAGLKAYVAYLVIDRDKNIVGEISWERIS